MRRVFLLPALVAVLISFVCAPAGVGRADPAGPAERAANVRFWVVQGGAGRAAQHLSIRLDGIILYQADDRRPPIPVPTPTGSPVQLDSAAFGPDREALVAAGDIPAGDYRAVGVELAEPVAEPDGTSPTRRVVVPLLLRIEGSSAVDVTMTLDPAPAGRGEIQDRAAAPAIRVSSVGRS